jgi:hypothetical protein
MVPHILKHYIYSYNLQVIPAFPLINEIVLCRNILVDYENLYFTENDFKFLNCINLE